MRDCTRKEAEERRTQPLLEYSQYAPCPILSSAAEEQSPSMNSC